MRSIILLSILLSSLVLYSQETCPTAQEQVEHDYREPLCEIYGETPPTITVNNGTSSQYPLGWTNEVVFITGKFRINTSFFLIEDCIIQLAPGAEIEVDQSNDLKVLDSYLFSCQEMWHGISVLSKARLDLTNSHIEDAQYAVKGYEAKIASYLWQYV